MDVISIIVATGIVLGIVLAGLFISKVPLIGDLFDFVAEMTSSFPWVYRGWLFLVSKTYRDDMKLYYKKYQRGKTYKMLDVLLSVIFMGAEIYLVVFIIHGKS